MPIKISFPAIQELFNVPMSEAALRLGVSETKLKGCCRAYAIKRWPFRKIQSLYAKLNELELKEKTDTAAQQERQVVQDELQILMKGPKSEVIKMFSALKREKIQKKHKSPSGKKARKQKRTKQQQDDDDDDSSEEADLSPMENEADYDDEHLQQSSDESMDRDNSPSPPVVHLPVAKSCQQQQQHYKMKLNFILN